MDDKKISAEKNAAEDEILSDEQLDSVAGGTNTGIGTGYIQTSTSNFCRPPQDSPLYSTGGGHG